MKIDETFYSESSTDNLQIVLEDGEMGRRVQAWARESSQSVKGNIKTKIRNILINVKQLMGITTFNSNKDGVRVLVDITAYNKLARFIEGSTTYSVANFTAAQVASFGKNINVINNTFGKAYRNSNKLTKLYDSMISEMRSNKARRLAQALNETKNINVSDELVFKTRIAPLIKNLLVATKKLNAMIETMLKSFQKLIINIEVLTKKTHLDISSKYNRRQKNDLMARCLGYVSYANKLLINMCSDALQRIDSFLSYYHKIFNNTNEE